MWSQSVLYYVLTTRFENFYQGELINVSGKCVEENEHLEHISLFKWGLQKAQKQLQY